MKLSETSRNILRRSGLVVAHFLVNVLLSTVRIRIENFSSVKKLINEKKNFVVGFWHGSMVIGWYLHRKMNCSALVSKSKDGNVLAHVLNKWNYKVIRGSSHIGGSDAMSILSELITQNYSLAITPDGPTGPIYKMKAGAVVAAKKNNVPLILAGIGCKRKIVFKSWDKFELPLPFSKVKVIYSDAIWIDKHLSYEETTQKILECENLLNHLQKDASTNC
jgi:hypothetical protein